MYDSPIFLDCCGLVRQALRDMKVRRLLLLLLLRRRRRRHRRPPQDDLGFTTGPWNQAYQLDTLPIRVARQAPSQPFCHPFSVPFATSRSPSNAVQYPPAAAGRPRVLFGKLRQREDEASEAQLRSRGGAAAAAAAAAAVLLANSVTAVAAGVHRGREDAGRALGQGRRAGECQGFRGLLGVWCFGFAV